MITPFYSEPLINLYQGHVLNVLSEIPSESVDMVMTSPPYWGLRTYKTEPIVWGDQECEHEWGDEIISKANDSNRNTMEWTTGGNPAAKTLGQKVTQGNFCLRCHAWKGELGLEPTIELYIEHIILIFNEIKRVLKRTGTCWVNIADSYAGNTSTAALPSNEKKRWIDNKSGNYAYKRQRGFLGGAPAKSLCAIPERFMLAMMGEGWICRNDIVWVKPNPMPESVKDRFTTSWEHLYFFTKSRKYWFEQQFEPVQYPNDLRTAINGMGIGELSKDARFGSHPELGRNKRDVWEINTQPYKEAHFATYPEKLCETPILAGCPSQICTKCGNGREKMIQVDYIIQESRPKKDEPKMHNGSKGAGFRYAHATKNIRDKGYSDCGCGSLFQPGVVLDPFAGSGTTLSVAKRLNRKSIGIELNPDYCKLAQERISRVPLPMELGI